MVKPRENIPNLATSLETPDYVNFANITLSKGIHVIKFCIKEKGQHTTQVEDGEE